MDMNPEAIGATLGALAVGLTSGAVATHKIIRKIIINDVAQKSITGVCPAPDCHSEREEVAAHVVKIAEKVENLEKIADTNRHLTVQNAESLAYIRGRIDAALKNGLDR